MFGLLSAVFCAGLLFSNIITISKLQSANAELARLRTEAGYLEPTSSDEIGAIRMTSDLPLTYRVRVRVPERGRYRMVYSSIWPKSASEPRWFGAVGVPPGESVLIVRVLKDPRDDRWKITALRRNETGTRRMATALPEACVDVFLGSHDWLRAGIPRAMQRVPAEERIRLLDERALVGEGSMMLYGDAAPSGDVIGIFAELQPDNGPI
ncbi:MAG: hypothetical protein AAF802_12955 [Planctomycetota bacterium]